MAAPNNRFACDIDGTGVVTIQSGVIVSMTEAQIKSLLSDAAVSGGGVPWQYGPGSVCNSTQAFVFPELRTVTHAFFADNWYSSSGYVQTFTSTDTTNGLDGTWTDIGQQVVFHALPINPANRQDISPIITGATNVRGIRFYRYAYDLMAGGNTIVQHVDLYGDRPTSGVNRLAIWHPTLDQEITDLDFGSVYRGTTSAITFRVKNISATQTASTITLSMNANGDYTPSFVPMFVPSPASFTSLTPGEISSVVTLTGTITTNAAFALMSLRLIAQAATWA